MNIAIWAISAILAGVYLGAGLMKLLVPKSAMVRNPKMAYAQALPATGIILIGAVEVLGAVGLIVPWATHIAPLLTPWAAVGLALVQLGAIAFHVRRGELKQLPVNIILLGFAVFVAWMRFLAF